MEQEENKDGKKKNDLSVEKYDSEDEFEEVKNLTIAFQTIIQTNMQESIMIVQMEKMKKFKKMSTKNLLRNLTEIDF